MGEAPESDTVLQDLVGFVIKGKQGGPIGTKWECLKLNQAFH